MLPLRQSTAVDVLIGPFVDITDGITAETGETPTVKVSKNGQTLAAKSDVTVPVHDADGYYNCELDVTDTDTVGALRLTVAATATATPVFHNYMVMDEVAYDALYGTTATILTSDDVGLVYESTIGTVTGPSEYIMDDPFTFANEYRYLVVSVEDISGTTRHVTWCTSIVQGTETITVDTQPPFTAVVGDKVRIYAMQHPRAAINNYAPATVSALSVFQTFVTGAFRLFARKDTDNKTTESAALTTINEDHGGGVGAFDPVTDSLEVQGDITTEARLAELDAANIPADAAAAASSAAAAASDASSAATASANIQTRIPAALSNGAIDANIERVKDQALTGDGSDLTPWNPL